MWLVKSQRGSRIDVVAPRIHTLFVTSACILLVACTRDPRLAAPDTGSVVAGVYTNDYFRLRLPIPDGWHVAGKETQERLRDEGEAAVAGDDPELERSMDASKEASFWLLLLSKFEVGANMEFNPSLTLMAERVSAAQGVRSSSDYLLAMSKMRIFPSPVDWIRLRPSGVYDRCVSS